MPAPTQPEDGVAEEGAKEGRARGKSEGCEEQVAAAAAPRWQADGGLQAARARQLLRWHRAFRRRLLGPALRHWCVHVAALPAGDVADAAARHMVATGAAARILVHFSGWHVRTLGSAAAAAAAAAEEAEAEDPSPPAATERDTEAPSAPSVRSTVTGGRGGVAPCAEPGAALGVPGAWS